MIIWDSSAIHCVSHRPDGPARGKNAGAGLRPERVRRDESRLYAAGIQLCGAIPARPDVMRAVLRPLMRMVKKLIFTFARIAWGPCRRQAGVAPCVAEGRARPVLRRTLHTPIKNINGRKI